MSVVGHRLPPDGGTLIYGNLLGMSSMFIWAASFPAAEILLQNWDPVAINVSRLLLSVLFLVPVWIAIEGLAVVRYAPWFRGLLIGGPTFGLAPYLLLIAQDLTDAVTVAILAATLPIVSTLIELLMGERKLRSVFLIGMGLSVVGAIIATGSAEPVALGWGALAMVASVTLFAVGSYFTIRSLPEVTPIGRTVLPIAGGLVVMAFLASTAHLSGYQVLPTHQIPASEITSLVVYALAGMAISQLLWVSAVGRLGVALASFHVNVAPFYVMLIVLALGGNWSWRQALGALVVITGVVIAQKRSKAF